MLPDLFENPVSKTKVRKGIYAYKYRNGTVNIEGEKYVLYSVKEAVQKWRQENPVKP